MHERIFLLNETEAGIPLIVECSHWGNALYWELIPIGSRGGALGTEMQSAVFSVVETFSACRGNIR